MLRNVNLLFSGVVCLAIAMIGFANGTAVLREDSGASRDTSIQSAQPDSGRTRPVYWPAADGASPEVLTTSPEHPVVIRKPSGPPRIELAGMDPQGRSGSVACSTCHGVREPNVANVSAATLDEFHQGMTFLHGNITCYACHNPENSDTLRLADGRSIEYQNVMTLCSQCHGPQATAFAHGAHGGMNGHWDLTRGPQMRNNCVDCHDPHAPAYPQMIVGFKPKDRFNAPPDHQVEDKGAESHDAH